MDKDISDKIRAIADLMTTMDECRDSINDMAKNLKELYGLNATYVKTVATALKNGKLDDLETKNAQIQNIIDKLEIS